MNTIRFFVTRHLRLVVGIALVVVVGIIGVIFFHSGKAPADTTPATAVRQVTLKTVGALSSASTSLTVVGEVRSKSQATLLAQKSGQVTGVNTTAGSYVGAGFVLAEIENNSERAAVLQAQGTVAAAEAALAKVTAGARPEDKANIASAAQSANNNLEQAKVAAVTAFNQAYTTSQDAILSKADAFFSDPLTARPRFRPQSALLDDANALNTERVALGEMLAGWKTDTVTLSADDDLDAALATAQARLQRVQRFLDTIGNFVSRQSADDNLSAATISTQEASMLAARSAVTGSLSGVTGAKQALTSARAGAVAASTQKETASTARPEDVQAAEAAVTQARGMLAGATALLEKTLIRTPISGTVQTLSIKQGDYVNMQQTLAVVANRGALEVEAAVSEDIKNRLSVGSEVLIEGTAKGVVTSIEPGLDPATKKSQVTIGLPGDATFTEGQFVEVAISGSEQKAAAPTKQSKSDGFYIPITAIKVLPDSLAVFTVSASSTLVAHTVAEGAIVGDTMFIRNDLTPDMMIVLDARGLNDGDTVTVAQ